MKKNFSIDELVREKLADGQEPHNLGAWANMERMLDGNDPYAKPNKRNNRKWLPFLLLFILAGGGAAVGYNYFQQSEAPTNNTQIANNTNTANSQAVASIDNNPASSSSYAEIVQENELPVAPTNASNNITTQPTYSKKANNNNSAQLIGTRTKKPAAPMLANKANSNKAATQIDKIKTNAKKTSSNNNQTPNDNSKNSAVLALAQKEKNQKISSKAKERQNKINTKKEQILASAKPVDDKQEYKEIEVPAVHIKQKEITDANGNKSIVFDSTESFVKMNVPVEKTNPRYVKLSETDKLRAEKETGITLKTIEELKNGPSLVASAAPMPATPSKPTSNAPSAPITSVKSNEKISFFARFKNTSKNLYQKANTATIRIADKQIPIYPGMIVGVNASMFNKHNFGGFQGGLTALTPLNRFLSLSMEARLMHKNNSGYTVNDYNYTVKNMSIDSNSVSSSKIYNYQVDSNALGYNFKNFYTMQMPILLNAHVKNFTFYSGINLEYGFRMDVRTTNKDYVVNVADTIAASSVYAQRSDIDKRFTRDDFASRFGLGYTVGGSYSFNPNLYLDLRFSNLFWDNAKTATKKEISNGFFRIPAIQFSLGYRFRKFDRQE